MPDSASPLPRADYLVVTWTVAEVQALSRVLTAGQARETWYPYAHNYDALLPTIRAGAPARTSHRLASYMPATIGNKSVLCVKSELHLNQDSKPTGEGTATLPVADLFRQMIAEVRPRLVITTGTAGGTFSDGQLGDVMVTRAAQFRLADEFRNAPFNGAVYRSAGEIPTGQLPAAADLMSAFTACLHEPDFGPPTTRYAQPGGLLPGYANQPRVLCDGRDFPKYHPILTTDYFEFGTSTNNLGELGCGVEMGDAVLGLVCQELGAAARWLVVRNASDPPINGALPTSPVQPDMQAHWAVFYYEQYGYWTSVNSAIATWALIAGDQP